MKKNITVLKASGNKELFSEEKYKNSLRRAHIPDELIDKALTQLIPTLREGINTHELYRRTYQFLKKQDHGFAGRYSLKHAILELGPTGYPFEDFVARLLDAHGFTTHVRQTIAGRCVNHEVDVIASHDEKRIMVECKFHNQSGIYSPVQTSLYVKARFDDLLSSKQKKELFTDALLITNTKFSDDARMFGECAGLKLISWAYPVNKGIEKIIEALNLYPITCLPGITKNEKTQLINADLVTCSDVVTNAAVVRSLPINPRRAEVIINQAHDMCSNNKPGRTLSKEFFNF